MTLSLSLLSPSDLRSSARVTKCDEHENDQATPDGRRHGCDGLWRLRRRDADGLALRKSPRGHAELQRDFGF